MQLKDLAYFSKVAELGNLHNAATALGVTQPALSKAIRRLETGMGVVLFERTSRGVALTSIGKALLARGLAIRQLVDDTHSELHDLQRGQSGVLRVGCVPSIVEPVLAPVLEAFLHDEHETCFETQVQLSGALLQQLETGALDFAIAAMSPNIAAGLNGIVLGQQRNCMVARSNHPLHRRRFTLQDLAAQRWVLPPSNITLRTWVESVLAGADTANLLAPAVFLQSDASPVVYAPLVRTSNLLTVMAEDSLRSSLGTGLRALPAPASEWTLQLGLFWRKTAYFSVAMSQFRDRVVQRFRLRRSQLLP
jgi:DNA-binding transcriptional LysR family regulator